MILSSKTKLFGKISLLLFILVIYTTTIQAAQENQFKEAYLKPPASVQDLLTRDRHYDTLNNLSPDGTHFLIPISSQFSSLKLMTQKTYRLGMLEICPDVNREWRLSTYGTKKLKLYSLSQRKSWNIGLPENIFVSDMTWSQDGKKIAFLAHLPKGTQAWTADVRSGKAEALNKAFVMATLTGRRRRGSSSSASQMLQWTPHGTVISLLVPDNRGPEPKKSPIPDSPIIRHTRKKDSPTSTYPFLMRTSHDKKLFKYYTTAQLAEFAPGKTPRKIGEPAMYMSISLSPDGKYILAEKIVEPFSYIVSYSSFPLELQVLDLSGNILATVRKIPLREAVAGSGRDRSQDDLPRDVAWRPDGKGLSFLWKEPKEKNKQDEEEEEESNSGARKDRLMLLAPPFSMDETTTLITSKKSLSSISYAPNGRYVFAKLSGRGEDGQTGTDLAAFDLSQTPPIKTILLKDMETKDPLKFPGDIITQSTGNGVNFTLLSSDGKSIYLEGRGYKENFKPQPYIDKIEITTGKKERPFEGAKDFYERPLVPLDNDLNRIIISRESKTAFPNSYLWEKDGTGERLTNNKIPYPELKASKRIDFEFTRRDGLEIQGRISLPPGYKKGTRVPAVFWTYPSEYQSFKDYKRSAIRGDNHNAFQRFSTRNASDIWLTQGYAVVVPDIPIIGKGNTYNNNFIAHLVDSMYAAIRKVGNLGYVDVDRLGHGGHSYGAFSTANILAHSPFFKAGIAGDGAYNRTLTPMTFQRERRFIWEAQDIYLEMSPFFQADHIDTPLLMYHGAVDNNTGTFLIQSERMIQALTGLGKNAVLYIYPFESHGPRCKETYMDMWARWLEFFDTYVKK